MTDTLNNTLLIAGAKGLAKDIVGAFCYESPAPELFLFDNVNKDTPDFLFDRYKVYKTTEALENHFKTKSKNFIAAVGSPKKRKKICEVITKLGGTLSSFLSSKALVSEYSTIKNGVIVQLFCSVSSDVLLDEGCFLNVGSILGHDVSIGRYTTVAPAVKILGNASIGDFCVIGTNTVVMPRVTIGNNVKIGVGKIVEKDVPDNTEWF